MNPTATSIALPRDAYHHLVFTLRALMPPVSASPEDLVRRDHAAIAQVASLCPANAAQAALAAQYVAANAYAMECLRLTRDPATAPDAVSRLTAQAASMMRQSQGAFRLLLRAQAAKAADGAAWTEYCAEQWMMDGLQAGVTARRHTVMAGESENPEQRPAYQYHETDSNAPLSQGIDAQAAEDAPPERDSSQIPGRPSIPQNIETDSDAASESSRTAPWHDWTWADPGESDASERELSRNMEHPLVQYSHGTDSDALPPNPTPPNPTPPDPTPPVQRNRSAITVSTGWHRGAAAANGATGGTTIPVRPNARVPDPVPW